MTEPLITRPRLSWLSPRRKRWLTAIWLLNLGLVLLITFTPLELNPLYLGNLPRWLLWGLAFPVTRWLAEVYPRTRWLWRPVPWLLWGGLGLLQLLWLVGTVRSSQTPATKLHRALLPLATAFYNRRKWLEDDASFVRGRARVLYQWGYPQSGALFYQQYRRVIVWPVLPGLQWARVLPDPADSTLDASWQLVDTASVFLSQDTALRRRVRPWVLGQRPNQLDRQREAWRRRRGLPPTNVAELLPPPTRYGANTLGCIIQATGDLQRESLWLPPTVRRGHDCQAEWLSRGACGAGPELSFRATLLFKGEEHLLHCRISGVRGPGIYRLRPCARPDSGSVLSVSDYLSTAREPARVVITRLDTLRGIVAGTFEGELPLRADEPGTMCVTLRRGRFDLLLRGPQLTSAAP